MNIRRLGPVLGLAFSLAFAAATDVLAHSGSIVEGALEYYAGDTKVAETGRWAPRIREHVIIADDGHRVRVDLSRLQLPPGGTRALTNKRVRVTTDPGTRVERIPPAQRIEATSVQVIAPLSGASHDFDAFESVVGNQKYITLLCRWKDRLLEPRLPGWFTTQMNSNTYPNFNHYFREVSYDQLNLDGSVASTQWREMPKDWSTYVAEAGGDFNDYLPAMASDCAALHNPFVDFTQYYGINLMFNDTIDTNFPSLRAWGGRTVLSLDSPARAWPVTWMPYYGDSVLFGWNDHGVLAHEMSHAFGAGHSILPNGDPYANQFDAVSDTCGARTVIDGVLGCVGQHEIAYNKVTMGILPAGRIQTQANAAASTGYTIERLAQPPTPGSTLMVKAMTPGPTFVGGLPKNTFYTVEARKRVGYDQNVPGDGVIIHRVIDTGILLSEDATLVLPPGATTGNAQAIWTPGSTFISAPDNVKITVNSFNSSTGTANVTVEAATAPGTYQFALAGYTVTEGGPAVNVAVTRTAPFTAAGSVKWTTADGTATIGSDFGTAGNVTQKTGTLTWTAGTGGTKLITVGLPTSNIPVINEGAAESAENFVINLSNPVGGVLGATTQTTVTVNDGAVIYFGAVTSEVGETGPNINLQLLRSGSTAGSNAVTFMTVAGSGAGFATATTDYTTTTGTVIFAPGETSKNIAVGPNVVAAPFVRVLNDAVVEAPETFTVRLSNPTNGAFVPLALRDNVVTINSDENGLAMVTPSIAFVEGAGAQTVSASRSGSAGAVDVTYSFVDGTAVNGTHYSGLGATLHWDDGETGQKTIPFTINDNVTANAARSFTVSLSGATAGVTLISPNTVVTINDNENALQFTAATANVTEGTANIVLSVTRTGNATAGAADVTWTAADGTAVNPGDYGGPTTGTLHWNQFDGTPKTISIPITNDAAAEGVKNFTVSLSSPVGPNVAIGNNSTITVSINDNDRGVKWELDAYNVNENAVPASVTLRIFRVGPSGLAMSANWATTNGTAVAGQDFGTMNSAAQRSGMVSWTAADMTPKSIVIPIINDAVGGEGAEVFNVTLTPSSGVQLAGPGTVQVTINDDDIPPQSTAQFSAPKYMVVEGVGAVATLTVTRTVVGGPDGSLALPAQVNYSMAPGTALATSDYLASTGTLTWAAGNNDPKPINVTIVNNTTAESPESFRVLLSGASPGLGIPAPEATVLILDDDEAFPADGIMPDGFATPVDTTAGWHVSNDPGAYNGSFSLKSDPINDGETAGLEMSGTFLGGNVTMYVKVSTEPTFDTLKFYVDGALRQTWSGTSVAGWQVATHAITAGHRVLRWEYTKDGSVSVGMDAVYLDGLVTPAFTPDP